MDRTSQEATTLAHIKLQHMQSECGRRNTEGDGRVFATHIAHEGNPTHAQLEMFAERNGYKVAYDGLVITVPPP